ncbi:MAG TPA: amino acid adenylation domain-containing protein [Aliidongia sp.]|uniref:non-ribosomal peptide synthetase n=1 Tax=Aliidongia sp. TaxID=1914230 RepID=UPI002DDD8235|nr:non-ribosomal peptide synthetase [Aliidongia sp.]HEV2678756.1 amino acid adenylation domain-containing protein [Aliidongia sp.]
MARDVGQPHGPRDIAGTTLSVSYGAAPHAVIRPSSSADSDLVSLLRMRADSQGDDDAYIFLPDGEQEAGRLTYGALWERAAQVAAFLGQQDCRNAPVLLLMPSSIEFLIGFYGCLLAGGVAIPAPPPHRTRGMERIRSIISDARPRLILAGQPAPTGADGQLDPALADIPWYEMDQVLAEAHRWRGSLPALSGDQPAILQYTSGSTGSPKGIVVTHANAFANILGQQQTTADPDAPRLVSWLPVHHDMGLFGNILAAPVLGGQLAFMPPSAFIQKPARWLAAISRYGAVRSGGPNFAYDLCARAISAEQMEGVDLRGWRTAYNGAEPVRAATLQQFARKFAPYGFQAEAWFPCYGLAETTLIVSGARRRRPPTVRAYARDRLGEGLAVATTDATVPTQTLVSSGVSVPDHAVRIVERETGMALGPRQIGEIWVAGPSVSPGFWQGPEASAERFGQKVQGEDGKFLRTGDLGFFDDDELFIVSRLDDLIVLRGRNIAPQDIEDAAIRSGTGAVQTAAAFVEDGGDGDRVVLVLEISRDIRQQEQLDAVSQAARDAVWQATEVALARLVLVRPGTIPRTTSGKVRRRSTRAGLASGEFKSVYDAAAPLPAEQPGAEGIEAGISSWLQKILGLAAPPATTAPLHRLGLDSLRTIEFSEWLRTTHGAQFSLADLLGGITLADVAAAVRRGGTATGAMPPADPAAGRRAHYPLTRTQEAIWAEQSRLGDSTAYNVPLALRLPDDTPSVVVENALRDLASRHPLLRSRFFATDAGPERHLSETPDVPLEIVDLSGMTADARTAEMAGRSRRPFEMQGQLLWRAVLYRWESSGTALVLTFHHVICDGWSVSALGQRLAASIEGAAIEALPTPDHDPIDQLVGEEEAYLCGREMLVDLEFWKQRLLPPPPPLVLPHRRDEDKAGEQPIHLHRIMIGGGRLARVRAAAEANDVSLPALLLALYGLFLHRSIGNDDIAVGVITSLRIPSRHGETLAPLVNPVVVRSRFTGPASGRAREFVTATSNELRTALAHNRLPLPMLVEALRLPTVPGLPPLFQAAFGHIRLNGSFDADAATALAAPASASRPFLLHAQEGSNPLSLAWVESDDACFGEFAVHRAWMSESASHRMGAQLDRLIDTVCADLDMPIATIPMVSVDERGRLETWSHGARAPLAIQAEGQSLHALILAQAKLHPDLTAVIESDGIAWTYGQLAHHSESLAAQLLALGLLPGGRVAVCMERSTLWLGSLLGILRAGGTFVPMDPQQPADRRAFIVTDSGAAIVLTEAGAETEFAGDKIVFHPTAGPSSDNRPALLPVHETSAAYILYTSGSTGRPKGVAVSHAALRERLLWKVETFEMTEQDRVLQSIPTTFDPSLWEIFTPLLCGAAVVLAPAQTDREPVRIAALARRHGITMMSCVSGVLIHLSDAFENQPPYRLRRVITGGEALTVAGRHRFQALTGATVDHFYGPTEATIFCTHLALPPTDAAIEEIAAIESIGRPVAGATVQIVDERGQLLPIGAVGEMVIGGLGLANGYLNRPEEDAKRFVHLDGLSGERFYRSGDSGRWREDGCLEIVGRTDDQIKLRGVRIEPGEIEAVLLQAPGVKEAAVSVEKRATGNVLAAWVALGSEGATGVDEDVLDAFARGRLPHALVPSIFHIVAKLPTLPSGKIDRNALAELAAVSPASVATAPGAHVVRSVMEGHLLRLWRDLLQAPDLQPTDDVFQAGAHSLMVMRLVGRLHAETGRTVPAAVFFDRRTPRRQALLFDNEERGASWDQPTLKLLSLIPNSRNLVCVAAGSGDRVRLEHLAKALGNDVTVWGLLPPGTTPDGKAWTIDSLSDAYAALVAEMLGNNGCVMAGFSAGGPLAHEAACRLRRTGHTVDGVLLFDSAHPMLPGVNVRIFGLIRNGLGRLGHHSWIANTWLVGRARQIFDDRGLYIHLAALPDWRGSRFDGPITIIRGSVTRWISGLLFSPWRRHAQRLDYENARGLHGGLFHNRNVDGVAAIVKRLMNKS